MKSFPKSLKVTFLVTRSFQMMKQTNKMHPPQLGLMRELHEFANPNRMQKGLNIN